MHKEQGGLLAEIGRRFLGRKRVLPAEQHEAQATPAGQRVPTEIPNQRLAKLQTSLAKIDGQIEHCYGPERVQLEYLRAVKAHQLRHLYDPDYSEIMQGYREGMQRARQSGLLTNQEMPSIRVRLWACDTLSVPLNSERLKEWLLDKAYFIVQDMAKDWQSDWAAPGEVVLIKKKIADVRTVELSPGVWVIEIDVGGVALGCELDECDPEIDAGDIIQVATQVLDAALSFKLFPVGDSETELSCYCGARALAQQYHIAKEMISERWPATNRLQGDTDLSFRGATKKLNRPTEQEPAGVTREPKEPSLRRYSKGQLEPEGDALMAERDGIIVAARFGDGNGTPLMTGKEIEALLKY
jgi:hypothetical protein